MSGATEESAHLRPEPPGFVEVELGDEVVVSVSERSQALGEAFLQCGESISHRS